MINKKKEIIKIIIATICLIIAIAVGFFIILSDYKLRRIQSNSMEPTLYENDICLIKKTPLDSIEIGDVICYKVNDMEVIHRVMVKSTQYNSLRLYTKGDNNRKDDAVPVNDSNFIGKVDKMYKVSSKHRNN